MLFSKVSSSKALGFKMKMLFWCLGIVFRVKLQTKRSAVYDEAPLSRMHLHFSLCCVKEILPITCTCLSIPVICTCVFKNLS